MSLTYGTTGIKQKDYRVYVADASTAGLSTLVANYIAAKSLATLNLLIAGLDELGECRADSIDLGIDDGDSIDGNVLGKIVLNKAGKFSVELINATPANIAALEVLDGIPCTILLVERDGRVVDGTHIYKTTILMNGLTPSYTEKITGGDSIRSTLNVEKNVPVASAFRVIDDINVYVAP